MYRIVDVLISSDCDLHRFMHRNLPGNPLQDYHTTCVVFCVSASLFGVDISVKQIAVDHALEYPSLFNP